jgi:hypothetical protein
MAATTSVNPTIQNSNLHAQTKIRIEQIARMRIAGLRDTKICEVLKMSPAVLHFITAKVEYKETEEALLLGHLTEMDQALTGKVDELRFQMKCAVPAAMRCILETVNQRRDLRTALAASLEVFKLDPDRTFSVPKPNGEGPMNVLPDSVMIETVKHSEEVSKQLKNKES